MTLGSPLVGGYGYPLGSAGPSVEGLHGLPRVLQRHSSSALFGPKPDHQPLAQIRRFGPSWLAREREQTPNSFSVMV
jgi:hypothetical protein